MLGGGAEMCLGTVKLGAKAGVDAAGTTLIGFSQGSIMALESTSCAKPWPRVISLAGRFAAPPRVAPAATQVHLLHGEQDQVIDPRYSLLAAEALRALGTTVSVELFPGLGHGIDARVAARVKTFAA